MITGFFGTLEAFSVLLLVASVDKEEAPLLPRFLEIAAVEMASSDSAPDSSESESTCLPRLDGNALATLVAEGIRERLV